MREHTILVDDTACIGCGLCRQDCPENNIELRGKKAVIRSQGCMKCGHCVAICPQGAVSMTGFSERPLEITGDRALEPEALLWALRTRRSMRRFTAAPVPPAALAQILEAGRLTPTGKNAQDVAYLVLEQQLAACEAIAVRLFRRLAPLARLTSSAARNVEIDEHFFFKKAPTAILVLSKDKVNGALAASNMERMAQACGLGVLYSGFFTLAANSYPPLRRALGLGRGERAVTTLVVGHPGVTYRRTAQREEPAVRRL